MCAQTRMLYGEFIQSKGFERLQGLSADMFWVYAWSFMVVAFFPLLYFLLAIVVDAFGDVKQSFADNRMIHSITYDAYLAVKAFCKAEQNGWPRSDHVIDFFRFRRRRPPLAAEQGPRAGAGEGALRRGGSRPLSPPLGHRRCARGARQA